MRLKVMNENSERRFRIGRVNNLKVKAFSALLFNKLIRKGRKHLKLMEIKFRKRRFMKKWLKMLISKRLNEKKLKMFTFKSEIKLQKSVIYNLKKLIQKKK